MNFETIILKKEERIATLTLNRPEQLNAINRQMEQELRVALEDIAQDREMRVMVLGAAGEKAFCAGGDMRDVDPPRFSSVQEASALFRSIYYGIMLRLYNLEIPTIAMVNGAASSWGFDLVLACDLRIGSENARFNSGFVRVGLTPATGGVWLMPRIMGLAKAAELIFTGDFIDAKEAERLGVLNKVVPPKELEKETMAMATRIAKAPPLAIKLAKLQLRRGFFTDLPAAYDLAAHCQAICATSEDFKEAIVAMFQKREAIFKGK